MLKRNRTNLETLILRLLTHHVEISLPKVAQEASLSIENDADRRAIQRAVQSLIKKELLQAKGAARARVYFLKKEETPYKC